MLAVGLAAASCMPFAVPSFRHGHRSSSGPAHRSRRLPARLPRYLRHPRHRRERSGDRGARRPRPSAHPRRPLHEGIALSRAHLPPGAGAAPAQARGRQGRGPLRAGELGGRPGRHRGPPAAHRRARRPQRRGHPALQLRRHHGPGAGREHGGAFLPPAGRFPARPHHLLVGRRRGAGRHLRRQGRHACGAIRREQADRHLGQQLDHLEPALLDLRPGRQADRGEAGLHRSAAHRHGGQVPRAHRPDAGHRRCAGARPDARADRERLARPRLHRAPHRRLAGAARARPAVAARAHGGGLRRRCRPGALAGARLRHHEAGRHPRQLRHAAGARRRQRDAADRHPALPGGRLAASGRRPPALCLGLVQVSAERRGPAAA